MAQRVEDLRFSPSPDGRCDPEEGPKTGPFYTGHFARGEHTAEVVHYGPFFVPTGKNVFSCGESRTIRYPEVGSEGPLFNAFGIVLIVWFVLALVAPLAVPLVLLTGGARLWRRGGGRYERLVGLAALAEGALLGLALLAYLVPACSVGF